VLREQGGGLIMQFSSMGGRVGGSPGIASYQAAKFAIDARISCLWPDPGPLSGPRSCADHTDGRPMVPDRSRRAARPGKEAVVDARSAALLGSSNGNRQWSTTP
jgi:hypothetical protein